MESAIKDLEKCAEMKPEDEGFKRDLAKYESMVNLGGKPVCRTEDNGKF